MTSLAAPKGTPVARRCVVIGAGPAGLIAAEHLAAAGHEVAVYDRMPSAGRKFLLAGRGGLNLTHAEPMERFLTRYGAACDWLEPMIRDFDSTALRGWADVLGQETFVGSSGRVFPRAMKTSPLLRAWLARLGSAGVTFHPDHRWLGWTPDRRLLFSFRGCDVAVEADATLLALGGASWPKLGSDGLWTPIVAAAGVAISPMAPSNMGIEIVWSPHVLRLQGSPLKRIAATVDGHSARGEAMITARGLEGGVIYALSPDIRRGIAAAGRVTLTLDLRPDLSAERLAEKLVAGRPRQSVSTQLQKLAGLDPAAIAVAREATGGPLPATPIDLARAVKAVHLTVVGTADLSRAISTAGGIRRDAVDDRLMLKAVPGVFAAGEMLDWEAPTGGYLLQATFATAHRAAKGMVAWLADDARTVRTAMNDYI